MAEVIVRSWRWAYRDLLPEDLLASLDPSIRAERIRLALEDPSGEPAAWVAEEDGRIVGAASAGPPLDVNEQPDAPEPPPDSGELYLIYVGPGSVGAGVGSAPLEASTEGLRAQGFSRAFLRVLEA